MSSPTRRSLEKLRAIGYAADVVERWIPRANVRRDLFSCIDLVAIRADKPGVLGIQACTAGDVSKRLRKISSIAAARTWLLAGNRLAVWGWRKAGRRWFVRKRDVRMEDLRG